MNSFAAHSFTPPPLKPRHSSTRINVFFLVSVYLVIATSISFELVATTQFLALLSGALLLSILAAIYLSKTEGIFSPLVLFSATYSGYAIGGLYYSQSGNYFGKFIGFLNIDKAQIELSLQYSLLFAITCYIFFALGYLAFRPKKEINFICHTSPFASFLGKYYFFLSFPLLTAGFIYWLWVAFSIAGGPINLVLYFQAFRHLISETSTTTLPYHIYFAGIYLWLIGATISKSPIGLPFIASSFFGMIMILTQGRIMLAITYVFAQLIFYALLTPSKQRKISAVFVAVTALSFVIYFLRIVSNYLFIGSDLSISSLDPFEVIIGGGNVADLQQLVIIFNTFDYSNALLGSTYIDWLRNSVGSIFDAQPSSVGLVIKALYVPEASGAPTPGAIGEAYANFSYGAPVFMLFVGALFSIIKQITFQSRNPFMAFVYAMFISRFIFLYPKVDSTMLVNFFWGILPTLSVICFYYIIYKSLTLKVAQTIRSTA